MRGGAWNNNSNNTRAANRNNNEPTNFNNNVGFRCARSRSAFPARMWRVHGHATHARKVSASASRPARFVTRRANSQSSCPLQVTDWGRTNLEIKSIECWSGFGLANGAECCIVWRAKFFQKTGESKWLNDGIARISR
ncbi:MAG: hypothetical protein HY868_18995 [Chloroflexi bacterium]|nr:hypothetical protein [Chloroflexota bacterium]